MPGKICITAEEGYIYILQCYSSFILIFMKSQTRHLTIDFLLKKHLALPCQALPWGLLCSMLYRSNCAMLIMILYTMSCTWSTHPFSELKKNPKKNGYMFLQMQHVVLFTKYTCMSVKYLIFSIKEDRCCVYFVLHYYWCSCRENTLRQRGLE